LVASINLDSRRAECFAARADHDLFLPLVWVLHHHCDDAAEAVSGAETTSPLAASLARA